MNKILITVTLVLIAVLVAVLSGVYVYNTAEVKMVKTCATYNGDLPQLEDTRPKCMDVRAKKIPRFMCYLAQKEPVYDKTPGLGPMMMHDRYGDSKYIGCRVDNNIS